MAVNAARCGERVVGAGGAPVAGWSTKAIPGSLREGNCGHQNADEDRFFIHGGMALWHQAEQAVSGSAAWSAHSHELRATSTSTRGDHSTNAAGSSRPPGGSSSLRPDRRGR